MNSDGVLDLVVANVDAANTLLLGAGGGAFELVKLPEVPGVANNAADVALGDVDGDGDLDAWFTHFSAVGAAPIVAQDRLWLGDGLGGFTEGVGMLPVESMDGFAVDLGDVDGDGDLDAVVGSTEAYGAPALASGLFLNNGSGVFAVSASLPAAALKSQEALLVDVDLDLDLDLCAAGVYRNDGAGNFSEIPGALPSGFANGDLEAGDVDGDLDVDLLRAYDVARLALNDGTGVFTEATGLLLPGVVGETYAALLEDLDGDFDLDIVLSVDDDVAVLPEVLLVNDGTGLFTDASSRLPAQPTDAGDPFAADVDADGDVDLLLPDGGPWDSTSSITRLYQSDGLSFQDVTTPLAAIRGARDVELADLDGDRDLDAVVSAFVGPGHVLLNDGRGELSQGPAFPDVYDFELGDVDLDGDSDVFAFADFDLSLYVNDGAAGFSAGAPIPQGPELTSDAALADVDGDGDLDAMLALHEFNPMKDRLLLGDGTGIFTDASGQLPGIIKPSAAVALGDVDQDGDVDAVFGNYGINDLLLNDGLGTFADAPAKMPQTFLTTTAVALADVDADADLDALIGNGNAFSGPQQNQLHLNDGSGTFTDAPGQVPVQLAVTTGVATGDPDDDGDADVFFTSSDSPSSGPVEQLWINDGTGSFAPAGFSSASSHSTGAAFGDVDGDKDDDLLIAGGDAIGLRVVHGLARHVAWRAVASIGEPLTMDLYGDPLSLWVLASSPNTVQVPFAGLGVLGIDPATLVTLDVGFLDVDGRAERTFQVPATPALVGDELHWQAIVGAPSAFTNVDTTTFTAL